MYFRPKECLCSDIRCPTLQDPTDGSVQYSSVNIGTVAEYSCSEGLKLKLVGESIRVCQSDGSWSGEMPHCQEGNSSHDIYCVCLVNVCVHFLHCSC